MLLQQLLLYFLQLKLLLDQSWAIGSFQAFEEGKYQGIGNTILHVILLIFIIITLFSDLGIVGIAISYILANIIALVIYIMFSGKKLLNPNMN